MTIMYSAPLGEKGGTLMKKAKYVAPKVVGSAIVHPCWDQRHL